MAKKKTGARILVLDIETAPLLSYTWGLWQQDVGLNQIHTDWYIIAWSAKWRGEKKMYYRDLRRGLKHQDAKILPEIWRLMNEADLIITQNGKEFDAKKLNARFVLNGMKPPSPYRHLDTLKLARRVFGFTSHKLAYMTGKLCTKYKKLTDHKFTGFDLWKECLAGNQKAWREMERYNKHDVLATEELYEKLLAWDNGPDLGIYNPDSEKMVCQCGSDRFQRRGFACTAHSRYPRFQCTNCGAWHRGPYVEFTSKKRGV